MVESGKTKNRNYNNEFLIEAYALLYCILNKLLDEVEDFYIQVELCDKL
jgi:hypothetical protein